MSNLTTLKQKNKQEQKHKHESAVIIFSGGLDSTVLLYQLAKEEYNLHALTFNYGQRFNREIKVSVKIIDELNSHLYKSNQIKHEIINIKDIAKIYSSPMIGDANKKVKYPKLDGLNDEKANKDSYQFSHIPFRNGIFLSIAVGYASSRNINKIFYAAHNSLLGTVFPDCTKHFVDAFSGLARYGTDNKDMEIIAPFVSLTKDQLIVYAKYMIKEGFIEVPLEKTYSCYAGTEINCGVCNNCVPRIRAFEKAGVEDKTAYKNGRIKKGDE